MMYRGPGVESVPENTIYACFPHRAHEALFKIACFRWACVYLETDIRTRVFACVALPLVGTAVTILVLSCVRVHACMHSCMPTGPFFSLLAARLQLLERERRSHCKRIFAYCQTAPYRQSATPSHPNVQGCFWGLLAPVLAAAGFPCRPMSHQLSALVQLAVQPRGRSGKGRKKKAPNSWLG